ncbi:glutathione peroxidase [Terricaulis sp.]|uniref:glutathione peroxidase n=1 Tax=Terricaulis sp. TaxID=2768686 RepID=UPI003784BCC2
MASIYDFSARDIDGKERPLAEFKGKVLLIVNTASQCGFTYQYEGLEALHRKYADKGVEVLAFPCNQFGKQEPGDADEIKTFCTTKYDVTFPIFAKIDVNGPQTHPLYAYLESEKRGFLGSKSIKWNFTKFLIGRDGKVLGRFAPTVKPAALDSVIARAL